MGLPDTVLARAGLRLEPLRAGPRSPVCGDPSLSALSRPGAGWETKLRPAWQWVVGSLMGSSIGPQVAGTSAGRSPAACIRRYHKARAGSGDERCLQAAGALAEEESVRGWSRAAGSAGKPRVLTATGVQPRVTDTSEDPSCAEHQTPSSCFQSSDPFPCGRSSSF